MIPTFGGIAADRDILIMMTVVGSPGIMSTVLNPSLRPDTVNIVQPDRTRSLTIASTAINLRYNPKNLRSIINTF